MAQAERADDGAEPPVSKDVLIQYRKDLEWLFNEDGRAIERFAETQLRSDLKDEAGDVRQQAFVIMLDRDVRFIGTVLKVCSTETSPDAYVEVPQLHRIVQLRRSVYLCAKYEAWKRNRSAAGKVKTLTFEQALANQRAPEIDLDALPAFKAMSHEERYLIFAIYLHVDKTQVQMAEILSRYDVLRKAYPHEMRGEPAYRWKKLRRIAELALVRVGLGYLIEEIFRSH